MAAACLTKEKLPYSAASNQDQYKMRLQSVSVTIWNNDQKFKKKTQTSKQTNWKQQPCLTHYSLLQTTNTMKVQSYCNVISILLFHSVHSTLDVLHCLHIHFAQVRSGFGFQDVANLLDLQHKNEMSNLSSSKMSKSSSIKNTKSFDYPSNKYTTKQQHSSSPKICRHGDSQRQNPLELGGICPSIFFSSPQVE